MRVKASLSPHAVGSLIREFAGTMAFIALIFAVLSPLLLLP